MGEAVRPQCSQIFCPEPEGPHQMAIPHAQPGEVIDARPLADALLSSQTKTLIKTPNLEMIRMVLPVGKVLSEHQAPGELIVQCIEGEITFTTMNEAKKLQAGDMLYLAANEKHAVEANDNSSFLLTIIKSNSSHS